MKSSRWQLGLPLFGKELIEQSARRRTYAVRMIYAGLLFTYAFFELNFYLGRFGQSFEILGTGQQIFSSLVKAQFVGIYIFMPAMVSGAIAGEKEKNTLVTLMITRLSSLTILFEKMLSRLIPMMTILLVSTPLLAFAYSLGGVTQAELWSSIWLLFLTCVQVASFTLMCSAFCSTTVSAFFATYMLGLFFMLPFTACIASSYASGPGGPTGFNSQVIVHSVILMFTSGVFFMLSLAFLVERAMVQPRNFLLDFFKGLDRFFVNLNDATTGGVILIKDTAQLPNDEAIGWLETSKKSLGTVRYLVRVLVVVEMPLLFFLTVSTRNTGGPSSEVAMVLLSIVWVIAVLMISVKSTTLISSERAHQTLDVLLTTPMTGREIMQQKFRGVQRLIGVMAVPFATIVFFELWWSDFRLNMTNLNYALCSFLSILIYLPLVAWLSFWIGIKIKSQARAILTALILLGAWILLPLTTSPPQFGPARGIGLLSVLSPAQIMINNETRLASFTWILLHFLCCGGFLFYLRSLCMMKADEYLGRCGDGAFSAGNQSAALVETAPIRA